MRHPNIVKFIDSFVDKKEQLMCILMDYCDGGDLSDLVQVRERRGGRRGGEGRGRREGENIMFYSVATWRDVACVL